MKILITDITGFVGSHLADYVLNNYPQVEIHGIRRWRSITDNVKHLENKVIFHDCDIKDAHNVYKIIEQVKPDKIFHLAAQSFVPASWEAAAETLNNNIIGECNILETIRKFRVSGYDPVITIAGSSEEYGLVYPNEVPIKETNPLHPLSPYAVSKIGQDYLAYQYWQSYKIRSIRTRAFNHTGPRRGEVFVSSNFAKQVAEIEKGIREPIIKVGNLEAIRDFTDVRDVVRAYWLAAEKCQAGEVYNICSGKGYKIKEILDKLISFNKIKDIKVVLDPQRMRPSDVPISIGDHSKFSEETGWQPEISFLDKTLKDLLDYWRERV